jgi:malate dehydrogenase (oxaloacetate-decarboxylating)(NADP+)
VIASQARHVTDEMFFEAAKALAREVSKEDLELGRIYPPLRRIREVSVAIATAVAEVAYRRDLAGRERPADLFADLHSQMFDPSYRSYV